MLTPVSLRKLSSNSADLNANFYDVLNSVSMVLAEFDKTVIEVAGHTDSTGSADYNMQLSQRRAQSVVAYLGTRNVRADRMIPIGAGLSHPIATNDTPEGRQLNRRVELTLVPLTLES